MCLIILLIYYLVVFYLQKKYIIDLSKIRRCSVLLYIVSICFEIIYFFSHLKYFFTLGSLMDVLFIYFSFIFLYQIYSIIRVSLKKKEIVLFEKQENKVFFEFIDILKLFLFTICIFPVLSSKFIDNDFLVMIIIVVVYLIISFIEIKINIVNISILRSILNTLRCFFCLVITQATNNISSTILFITVTKGYEYLVCSKQHFSNIKK